MSRIPPFVAALALAAPLAAQAPTQLPHHSVCGVPYHATGPACPPGFVLVPAGWYSGDTHEHVQQCFSRQDYLTPEIYTEMVATNLDVSSALIWGAGFITPDQFLTYAQQYVTGTEDPSSAGDPDRILWAGVETSGISAGNLGHMIGLNLGYDEADLFQLQLGCTPLYPDPGYANDGSGDYSKPVLDHMRKATGAVTGYAHQAWPVTLYEDVLNGGWDWEDRSLPSYVGMDARCSFDHDLAFPVPKTCGNTHPVLAPFDVALGRIDFVEAFDMLQSTCGGAMEKRYFGMYYKLLNAGQRIALSAGTDADCIGLACPPRVYVKLFPGDAFTYESWTRALAAGRTSLANGPYQFLDLEVEGAELGDTVELSSLGQGVVHVKATYSVEITDATTVTDVIEIVQDGEVVASEAFGPLGSGQHVFELDVPMTESGWIAARTASYATHTGAVYVHVDGAPIASCADAEYWTLYADYLSWNLDVAASVGPGTLELYAGCSEAEIRAYIAHGRKLYAAVRDYDADLPLGIQRLGTASPPACAPPAALVTADVPAAGQPFTVRYFNAPPGASGGLVIATQPAPVPLPVLGAVFHVLINPSIDPVPLLADEGGYGEIHVPKLPSVAGVTAYVQGAWINPPGCDETGLLSSSDAIGLTIQP